MATQTQRISDLFDHLWPLTGYHFRWEMHEETRTAVLSVMRPDRQQVLANVSFEPKLNHDYTPAPNGYRVSVTLPAFNGTIDQLEEPAVILAALSPVLRKMSETTLISGVAP